jgi:hypothetical protein
VGARASSKTMRRYAAEVDNSSIAKSPFIFGDRNGATSHTFGTQDHFGGTEADRFDLYALARGLIQRVAHVSEAASPVTTEAAQDWVLFRPRAAARPSVRATKGKRL